MSNRITEEEIIDFYKTNLEISIRKEDLLRPTRDFCLDLFTTILDQGFDVRNLDQIDILACENYSEDMNQGYFQINVYCTVNKLVQSVGLNDFKQMDILMPKRPKTIRILHALANAYVRYSTIKADWFEYAEKFVNRRQTMKELVLKKNQLKHEIESTQMLLSSMKNKSIGEEKELKLMEEKFAGLKQEAEKEEKKATDLKAEIAIIKEKLCEIQLESNQLEEINKKLSSEIIESPMKIIEATKILEKRLESYSETYQNLKQQQNELLKEKTLWPKGIEILTCSIKELNEIFELLTNIDEKCTELENANLATKRLEEEMKEIEIEIKNIEINNQKLENGIQKENLKYSREKQTLDELLNGLKEKIKSNEKLSSEIKETNNLYWEKMKSLEMDLKSLMEKELKIHCHLDQQHKIKIEKILNILKLFQKTADINNSN